MLLHLERYILQCMLSHLDISFVLELIRTVRWFTHALEHQQVSHVPKDFIFQV